MSAYWIVLGTSRENTAAAEAYRAHWKKIADKYGARIEAGPVGHVCKEGEDTERLFIVRFPSLEKANACYEGREYQAARQHGIQAYNRRVFIVPGNS